MGRRAPGGHWAQRRAGRGASEGGPGGGKKSPLSWKSKPGAGLCTGPKIVMLGLSQRKNLLVSKNDFLERNQNMRLYKILETDLSELSKAEQRERSEWSICKTFLLRSQLCSEKGLETSGMFEPLTKGQFSPGPSKGRTSDTGIP